MYIGVVYPVRYKGEDEPKTIEVAWRGERQLLPGRSMTFSSEEELGQALNVVLESLDWPETVSNPDSLEEIWNTVKGGIGWDWHPSYGRTTIELSGGRRIVVSSHD